MTETDGMISKRIQAAIIGVFFSVPHPVFAICPKPTPKVCSSFFERDVVFVGAVLSQGYSDENEYLQFRLRVSEVLRGSVGRTALVYSGNDSGRVLWEVGQQYVVFAQRANGRLLSGGDCGPLSDPGKVAETIRQVKALRTASVASVEGEVLMAEPEGAGVPDVVVKVRGGGKTYEATTDAHGVFQLSLPPGRYQVLPDAKLRRSDYNPTDPRNLILVAGQCAQLQYVAR